MTSTTLPIHPVTGLRALGMTKRGPIWPVIGGNGEGDGNTGDAEVTEDTDADAEEGADNTDEGAEGTGDGTDNAGDSNDGGEDEKKFTQADLDRILKQRLAREKPKGNEKDAEDAARWREYQDSQKDDETRRAEELEALRTENAELKLGKLRDDVLKDKKLPAAWAKFLTGETREAMEDIADELLAGIPTPAAPPASDKPTPKNTDSKKSSDSDEVFDPKAVAALIPRR